MSTLETPVALFVFNDPEATRRVFAEVAAARPSRLLLIADGPRTNRPYEAERCAEVKEIVSAVGWQCKVETNYSSENMGPRRRIISGIDWVFSLVEEAIILEHDCLPDASFFPFCSEMLERYRNRPQIGYITGFNPLEKEFPFRYSYYYSMVTMLWGWATWRRVWQEYDEHLRSWPQVKEDGLLRLLFPSERAVAYWTWILDRMYEGTGPSTWDFQFAYTCWTRNWLSILPRRNLIQYIGFGPQALHTTGPDRVLDLPAGALSFPLTHPPAITPWPANAMQMQRRVYARRGILGRIRSRIFSSLKSVAR
jgi:hypothetical protein